ncbi:YppF family protein [Niallia sp. XMNu-256]|uniref:YppF family protein n=1 Tax=Niallia sp. XMNu-256 TaxID=3082444 RepID=UPI0030CF5692
MLEILTQRFNNAKKRNPSHVNELLDFIQVCYIQGELTITEYKGFFSELDKQNAEKPEVYIIKNTPFNTFNIPG